MAIAIKRVYESPSKNDGVRILVDRLWPRGVSKTEAAIDMWAKDLSPSNALRTWFHENREERYKVFAEKYRKELQGRKEALQAVVDKATRGAVTLVTAVKDVERSHVSVLLKVVNGQ